MEFSVGFLLCNNIMAACLRGGRRLPKQSFIFYNIVDHISAQHFLSSSGPAAHFSRLPVMMAACFNFLSERRNMFLHLTPTEPLQFDPDSLVRAGVIKVQSRVGGGGVRHESTLPHTWSEPAARLDLSSNVVTRSRQQGKSGNCS